jgi:hypothetical protein
MLLTTFVHTSFFTRSTFIDPHAFPFIFTSPLSRSFTSSHRNQPPFPYVLCSFSSYPYFIQRESTLSFIPPPPPAARPREAKN